MRLLSRESRLEEANLCASDVDSSAREHDGDDDQRRNSDEEQLFDAARAFVTIPHDVALRLSKMRKFCAESSANLTRNREV